MGGKKMSVEALFIAFIFASIAVYGVWKYTQAESNDMKRFVDKANAQDVEIKDLKKRIGELEERAETSDKLLQEWGLKIQTFSTQVEEFSKEVDAAQVHMEKLRKGQIDLRDRSYPRHIELTLKEPLGAIPVEIYVNDSAKGPKAGKQSTINKVKKQIQDLSK